MIRPPTFDVSSFKQAELWEIWHKPKRQRLWIAIGHDKVVRTDDDPLGLSGFFRVPCPLYVVKSNSSSMVPIPEFTLYEDQADELDRLQEAEWPPQLVT